MHDCRLGVIDGGDDDCRLMSASARVTRGRGEERDDDRASSGARAGVLSLVVCVGGGRGRGAGARKGKPPPACKKFGPVFDGVFGSLGISLRVVLALVALMPRTNRRATRGVAPVAVVARRRGRGRVSKIETTLPQRGV